MEATVVEPAQRSSEAKASTGKSPKQKRKSGANIYIDFSLIIIIQYDNKKAEQLPVLKKMI
jgi:hypothetical protein